MRDKFNKGSNPNNHNLLTIDSLIYLEVKLELKIHVLESIRTTQDHALAMINQIHKPFIEKYSSIPPTEPQQ